MKSLTFSDALALCSECSDPTHSLVFYLSIAFGILFLVMLIVNLYLCCAMSRYGGITYRRKTSTTSNSSSDSNSDDVSKNSTVPRSEKTTSPGKSFSSGSIDTWYGYSEWTFYAITDLINYIFSLQQIWWIQSWWCNSHKNLTRTSMLELHLIKDPNMGQGITTPKFRSLYYSKIPYEPFDNILLKTLYP